MHQSAKPTSLEAAIGDVDAAIGLYGALRQAMFKELISVPKAWSVQYKRDPAKGIPGLPVKWTHEVSTKFTLGGLPLEAGVATIDKPETYAPFHDFKLLDPAGNHPTEGSEVARVEMRLSLTLERLLGVVRTLAGGLPFIVRYAGAKSLRTDTVALSRLAHALPVFPYWPTLKGMAQADWDKIIADEKPLLENASFVLHLLTEEAVMVATLSSPKPPVSAAMAEGHDELRNAERDFAAEAARWKEQILGDAEESTREIKAAIKRWVPEWDGRQIPWGKVFAILVRQCNVRPADFGSLTPVQVTALLNDSADMVREDTTGNVANDTAAAFQQFSEAVGRSASIATLKAAGVDLGLLSTIDRELIETWLDRTYELAQTEAKYRDAGGINAENEDTHWLARSAAKNALAGATNQLIRRAQEAGVEDSTLTHFDDARRLLTSAAAADAERFLPRVVAKLAASELIGIHGNPPARAKLTKGEANIKARHFLREHPNATASQVAKGIGCSQGLVSGLTAWQAVMEQRAKGRTPKKATTVSLTPKLQGAAGVEDDPLARLIGEQEADAEPSPLKDDSPDRDEGAPRKAKVYGRR